MHYIQINTAFSVRLLLIPHVIPFTPRRCNGMTERKEEEAIPFTFLYLN